MLALRTVTYCTENEETPSRACIVKGDDVRWRARASPDRTMTAALAFSLAWISHRRF
ncbi:hypothetical protein CBM2587_A160010 [Cupriavidus taiwanensis]|uniref:Uncharacterized protein n=1 Tax=Cupriavidus taiwanensis TaxID=164546 RepID=A0A375BIE4_9BURK|nr:hypothetical protein CBM2587_A160010 [Cupriavidus taiwanensis]